MIKVRTREEILNSAIDFLLRNSTITQLAPGSTARALIEATVLEATRLYGIVNTAMAQAYVSTASGLFLDLLAETVGLRRRPERAPYISASDRNIRFYVNSGTLGDYIPKPGDATKALIPEDTTIQTATGSVVFIVDSDHEAPAGATEMYVTARASTVGPDSSVGVGTLTVHDLGSSGVLVTNLDSITTTTEIESDDELRFRIQNAAVASETGTVTSIQLAALSVGGVSDVIINPYTQGSGSFEILIIPIGNRVPVTVLEEVRAEVSRVTPFGITFIIREPEYVPISLDVELMAASVEPNLRGQLRNAAAAAISSYVSSLRPGGQLVINRIREAVLATDGRIDDLRIRALRIKGRSQILSNFRLDGDQVFIPDPDETTPFLVR